MAYERVEVITSVERRRRWSAREKLRLVAESHQAEGGVGVVADRAGLHRSLLQRWRRQVRDGTLVADRRGAPSFVPLAIDDGAAGVTPALATAAAGRPHGAVRGLVEIDLPNGCRVRFEQDIPQTALRRIIGGPGSAMIGIPPGVRILIAMQPVDFRRGADSLAALAKEVLQQDPFSGTVLVFRAKRADRVKVVAWDGSGLVMLWKRLDDGAFKWPPVSDGVMRLTSAQLSALLEGLDWSRVHALRRRSPTAVR